MSTTSRSACRATASAAAAVSALTLCTTPSRSGAMLATTGTRPASISPWTASVRTVVTSPTSPRSTSSPSTSASPPGGGEQPAVLPGHADRQGAEPVDQADQVPTDLADQHHPDDLHRLRAGHPEPAAELRGDVQPGEHLRDLRAAAVDDHRVHAAPLHEHDVGGEGLLQLLVDHGVAAVLDHHGLAGVRLQPGQRLGQDRGLLDQGERVLGRRGALPRVIARAGGGFKGVVPPSTILTSSTPRSP